MCSPSAKAFWGVARCREHSIVIIKTELSRLLGFEERTRALSRGAAFTVRLVELLMCEEVDESIKILSTAPILNRILKHIVPPGGISKKDVS